MAIPTRQVKFNEIADLDTFYNGGKGSGNFGHSGRPGEVGGSGKGKEDLSNKKSEIKLEQAGIESRIEGLSKRIKALEKGMKKDK